MNPANISPCFDPLFLLAHISAGLPLYTPLLYTPPDFSTNFFAQCEFFGENHWVLPTILPIFQNIVKKARVLPMDFPHFQKITKKARVLPMNLSHFSKNHQKSKGPPYGFISFFKKSSK